MDKLNVIQVHQSLSKRGITIFSLRDFVRLLAVSEKTARSFLSYQAKKGVFTRVSRGLYIISNNPPPKFEIANRAYQPSYISFESALSRFGIIPETVYSITSATPLPTRVLHISGQQYEYHQLKKTLYFGYHPEKLLGRTILIADREKALLDYLYFRALRNMPVSERLDVRLIDQERLRAYMKQFEQAIRKKKYFRSLVNKYIS